VCCALQRTVPFALKFLGPLLLLVISLARLCGGLKKCLIMRGSVVVPEGRDVATIRDAMQAHESQFVWCVVAIQCAPCPCYDSSVCPTALLQVGRVRPTALLPVGRAFDRDQPRVMLHLDALCMPPSIDFSQIRGERMRWLRCPHIQHAKLMQRSLGAGTGDCPFSGLCTYTSTF
jgi:hypothetical protein